MVRKLLVLLLFVSLLVGIASALAQVSEIEMIGAIEAVNADGSIVVNGQVVLITGAEVNTPLTVGAVVKVEGQVGADGIIAREVQAPNANDLQDDEIEITGQVDAVDGNTITIGGFVIDLTGAEITGDIIVGEVVKVHVSTDNSGGFVAREAEVVGADDNNGSVPPPAATEEPGFNDDNPRAGEFEIVGTIEEVGAGFIVVNGQTIQITGAEIKNQLVVGALVKIHLSNNNGALVAREVENADTDNDQNDDRNDDNQRAGEFEIVGTIEEVGAGFIVVNGQTIQVTGAEIKNQLVVGAVVKIHLSNNGGTLVAREVENADRDDDNRGNNRGGDDSWDDFYTIRPGDTLSDIARRAGTTVEEIARRNNIADIRMITVGTTLLLPDEPFDDDNSGRGNNNDDDDDDDNSNSGSGSHDDDDDDNSNSGSGSHDDDDDGGNSGSGSGNSGSGSRNDDDD